MNFWRLIKWIFNLLLWLVGAYNPNDTNLQTLCGFLSTFPFLWIPSLNFLPIGNPSPTYPFDLRDSLKYLLPVKYPVIPSSRYLSYIIQYKFKGKYREAKLCLWTLSYLRFAPLYKPLIIRAKLLTNRQQIFLCGFHLPTKLS